MHDNEHKSDANKWDKDVQKAYRWVDKWIYVNKKRIDGKIQTKYLNLNILSKVHPQMKRNKEKNKSFKKKPNG